MLRIRIRGQEDKDRLLRGQQEVGVRGSQRWAAQGAARASRTYPGLDVEIQLELVRMRPQTDRIDFTRALVTNPHFQRILGKDIAFGEELMIVL